MTRLGAPYLSTLFAKASHLTSIEEPHDYEVGPDGAESKGRSRIQIGCKDCGLIGEALAAMEYPRTFH